MTQQNDSTMGQAASGAFGGEMKYLTIFIFIAAGILVASMLASMALLGPQYAIWGLIIGLVFAAVAFFGGFFLLYFIFYQKVSLWNHFSGVVIDNGYDSIDISWFWEELGKETEEIGSDNQPTGWRNKRIGFMELTDYNPKYYQFGKISEAILHYYGRFEDYVELRKGTAVYKDMELPHGKTDNITLKPIKLAYLNSKYGERIPVFQLIGGRFLSKNYDPTRLIPHPNTHLITVPTVNGQVIAAKDTDLIEQYRKENADLRLALAERQRQSEEDKEWAVSNAQIHSLDASENDAIRDLSGNMLNVAISTLQHVIAAVNDLEDALDWLMRGENKFKDLLPIIMVLIIFFGILGFIAINPDLMNQLVAATQNPIVDITVIALAGFAVLGIYFFKKRRRKR